MAIKKLLYQGVFWRGISLLSFFVLNVAIARSFGATVSGSIFFMVNWFALLLLVGSLSLESGLGYYTARKEVAPVVAGCFALCWSVLVAFAALPVLPDATLQQLQLSHKGGFPWLPFVYVAGYLSVVFFTALYNARQNIVFPNVLATLANLVLLCGLVFAKQDAAGFIRWYFTGFLVQGALLALFFLLQYGFQHTATHKPGALAQKIFIYSLQAFAANLIFFLVYRIDYWVVNYYCKDSSLLGNYIQVSKLGQVFFVVPGVVATAIFSVTAGEQKETMMEVAVQRLCRMLFAATTVACVLLVLMGYWLFPVLFGPDFSQMYLPFVLLTPGVVAIASLYPVTAFLAGRNKQTENIKGLLFALLVIVSGDLLLVPRWDIKGAAVASSMGYLCYQWYLLWRLKTIYGMSIRDYFVPKLSDWQLLRGMIQYKKI